MDVSRWYKAWKVKEKQGKVLYKEGLGWLPRFVSGESHGFLRPGQLCPWGAGILNKPKNQSCHLPTANFTFTPIFHQKFLLKFLLDLLRNCISSLSFGLELNFKRGIARRYLEQIKFGLRRYFSSCIVIWEPHFLLVNTQCISLLVSWYWLIFADRIFNWRSLHCDLNSSHWKQPTGRLLSRSNTT